MGAFLPGPAWPSGLTNGESGRGPNKGKQGKRKKILMLSWIRYPAGGWRALPGEKEGYCAGNLQDKGEGKKRVPKKTYRGVVRIQLLLDSR